MKIRQGFVSNSSSSSFTLCVPKGTTEEEIRLIIEKQVGKMEGFFLPNFRQDIIDTLMESKGDKNEYISDLKFEKEWNEEHPDASTGEQERLQAMADDEFDYYQGGFSDNGDGPIQCLLCYADFKVEGDNFSMENDAGY
jgi:hypothetical protein